MKRKMLSLSTAVLFLSGVIIAPAYCFASEFIVKEKLYLNLSVKSFSKNILLSDFSTADFNGFTENLLKSEKEDVDFSNMSALLNKDEKSVDFNRQGSFKSYDFTHKNPLLYNFSILERLRSPIGGHNYKVLFIFFILLYIGMLKSVFVFSAKSKLFYILKPLFTQTRVFYLRVLK